MQPVQTKMQVVIPHVVKVALYYFISGGLTLLLVNIANLHLQPYVEMMITGLINIILVSIKKLSE